MLFDFALLLTKIILGLLLAYFLVMVYYHVRAVTRVTFYQKQGAVVYPGATRFYFGNNIDLLEYGKARSGETVVTGPHAWLIFKNFPRVMGFEKGKEFSAAEYPLVVCNF